MSLLIIFLIMFFIIASPSYISFIKRPDSDNKEIVANYKFSKEVLDTDYKSTRVEDEKAFEKLKQEEYSKELP